jgi:hypothetical protein
LGVGGWEWGVGKSLPFWLSDAEQQASREKLRSPSLVKKTWDHYYSKLR